MNTRRLDRSARTSDFPIVWARKVQTLFWYLRRPSLYPELARRIRSLNISTARSVERAKQDKEEGRRKCEERVAEPTTVADRLGLPREIPSLTSIHQARLDQAQRAVDACPVKMGGPANLEFLHHVVRHLPAKRVVETGVANGWSSLAVLLAMADAGGGTLVSVDMPYAKMNNETWVGCAVPEDLRASWTLIRRADRDGLPEAVAQLGTIDLAHHDSDKSHDGRLFAYDTMWAALRPGGVLMSDDIEDNLAFFEFAERVGREPFVLQKKPGNYAGVLVR